MIQVMCPEGCFDELLSLVERTDQFMCNPEVQGCGKFNYKLHILSTQPHVFTTGDCILVGRIRELNWALLMTSIVILVNVFAVLGWQNTCESVDDIRATLAALTTDINIGVLYGGLDSKCRHRLISVVYLLLKFCLFP